jgi:excisionase family DNA binding protein
MATTPQTTAPPKRRELAKISTTAKRLDVSMDTIDRLVKAGKLPIVRLPSGRRRIDLAELDALIDDWAAGSR